MKPDPLATTLPDGPVAIFPLPDFVLFPGVTTPLHIFEPRYRRMIDDALDGHGYLVFSAYVRHPAHDQGKDPGFYGTGCLARLEDYERLEDGRFNILVKGLDRVFVNEVEGQRGYRCVQIRPRPFSNDDSLGAGKEQELRLLSRSLFEEHNHSEAFRRYLEVVPAEDLLYLMAFHAQAPASDRQALLESDDLPDLCDQLIDLYKLHS
jgi:Lon protease-like protein